MKTSNRCNNTTWGFGKILFRLGAFGGEVTHIAYYVTSQILGASHGKMFHAFGKKIALAVPNRVGMKHVEVPLQR